jgi:hypothetical protein
VTFGENEPVARGQSRIRGFNAHFAPIESDENLNDGKRTANVAGTCMAHHVGNNISELGGSTVEGVARERGSVMHRGSPKKSRMKG